MNYANSLKTQLKEEYIQPCNDNCSFCFLNYIEELKSCPIFKDLMPEIIADIIKTVRHQVKTYQKGEFIVHSGDPCNNLKIIVKGQVVSEMIDFRGKSLRIDRLSASDTIASSFIFGTVNKIPVNVIALEETKLLLIPKQSLMGLFCKNDTVLRNFLDVISNRAQKLSEKIKLLGLQSLKGKVAFYLLEQAKRKGCSELMINHSQNELANMFGVSRPSLARVIREIHNEKIIHAIGKRITIINQKALSDFLR